MNSNHYYLNNKDNNNNHSNNENGDEKQHARPKVGNLPANLSTIWIRRNDQKGWNNDQQSLKFASRRPPTQRTWPFRLGSRKGPSEPSAEAAPTQNRVRIARTEGTVLADILASILHHRLNQFCIAFYGSRKYVSFILELFHILIFNVALCSILSFISLGISYHFLYIFKCIIFYSATNWAGGRRAGGGAARACSVCN